MPAEPRLFYPDHSPGGSGCKNDGNVPDYMSADPSQYLSSTLDKCCSSFFPWNYEACLGIGGRGVCARSLWYPDWEGSNVGCIDDGNEPKYMTDNPVDFLYSSLEDCCQQNYSYDLPTCTRSAENPNKDLWYPNWDDESWGEESEVCKTGGGQPTYMNGVYLYATVEDCCQKHYGWKVNTCINSSSASSGASSSPATMLYYPDWSADVCKNDGGESVDMNSNYMYETLDACCEEHFNWNLAACSSRTASDATVYYADYLTGTCKNDGGETSSILYETLELCCDERFWWRADFCKGGLAETNQWYKRHDDNLCVKDCAGDDPCGGVADPWESAGLEFFATRKECCEETKAWDSNCMTIPIPSLP